MTHLYLAVPDNLRSRRVGLHALILTAAEPVQKDNLRLRIHLLQVFVKQVALEHAHPTFSATLSAAASHLCLPTDSPARQERNVSQVFVPALVTAVTSYAPVVVAHVLQERANPCRIVSVLPALPPTAPIRFLVGQRRASAPHTVVAELAVVSQESVSPVSA